MINEYLMYFYVYKHDIFTYHLFPQNDSDDGENSMNGKYCVHGLVWMEEKMNVRVRVWVCVRMRMCGRKPYENSGMSKGDERTNKQNCENIMNKKLHVEEYERKSDK